MPINANLTQAQMIESKYSKVPIISTVFINVKGMYILKVLFFFNFSCKEKKLGSYLTYKCKSRKISQTVRTIGPVHIIGTLEHCTLVG